MSDLRCMAWNLGHLAREAPIRPEIWDVIERLRLDVVTFNEFVDGPTRNELRGHLHRLGLVNVAVSQRIDRSNQVLVASRVPLEPGHLASPMPSTVAAANWLHVRLPSQSLDLVAFRMPWWKLASERHAYRDELGLVLESSSAERLVACGDFNFDPFAGSEDAATTVLTASAPSVVVPRPDGEWSFVNKKGTGTARIDHVAHTRSVTVTDVRYVAALDGVTLAGPHRPASAPSTERPISDHAALLFTVRSV